jgi:hypothetical protein
VATLTVPYAFVVALFVHEELDAGEVGDAAEAELEEFTTC